MEGFVSGNVVVINFPFSNLKEFKKRPALVLKTFLIKEVFKPQKSKIFDV